MEKQREVSEQSLIEKSAIIKKRNNGKIIAHAAGRYLYCVECHKDAKNRLKRMPEKIELPDNPRTVDDVGIFICKGCKKIFGKNLENALPRLTPAEEKVLMMWLKTRDNSAPEKPGQDPNMLMGKEPSLKVPSEEEPYLDGKTWAPNRLKKKKDFTDLLDMVDDSVSKISFLGYFFCGRVPDEEFEMNSDDASGLYRIITDIQDDLKMVLYELSKKRKEGLIIEKEMS